MFYTRIHSPKVRVSVANSQWYAALYKLERTTSLLDNPIELRKLIPSATNIYNQYKTLDQRDDIIEAQKFLMLKINLLENSNDTYCY
jgi:hypothetical protein